MGTGYTGTLAGITFEDGRPVEGTERPENPNAVLAGLRLYAKRHGLAIVDDRLVIGGSDDAALADAYTPVEVPSEPDDDAKPEVPKPHATKAVWLAYAISRGADPVEAEKSTRDALAEAYTPAASEVPKVPES